jgi:5-formyltetrahydrofolate cyclo-ligase
MSAPDIACKKEALRRKLLGQRRRLSKAWVQSASQMIHQRLRSYRLWHRARAVALYAPVNNEVDTWPLIQELWAAGKPTFLPRCRPGEDGMELGQVCSCKDLRPGRYQIPEPRPGLGRPTRQALELIIAPCLGVDRSGYRLGYGGGYYDRFLAGIDRGQTLVLALSYACQLLDQVPKEPWDIPVDLILTEDEDLWTNSIAKGTRDEAKRRA